MTSAVYININKRVKAVDSLADVDEKEKALRNIAEMTINPKSDENLRGKEEAILKLGALYAKSNKADDLAQLIKSTRPFLGQVSKAKAGKLVRTLVDLFLDLDASTGQEIQLCTECIEWSQNEKRAFLRQALQVRLMGLYYDVKRYSEALQLGSDLLKELKKMDDKVLLVEVQLMESKIYYSLANLQKSRAALTSARTTANAIYCPTKLQAGLDLQAGILHAADERDFKTAYSYFYEAFESYDLIDNRKKAIDGLKYMLLSKIMLNQADEVPSIITTKLAVKHAGKDVEAMAEIAKASSDRSIAKFIKVQQDYHEQLGVDPIITKHLKNFYDTLLTENLKKIIEPFSRVQIGHIAKLIDLPQDMVERKLSQMILDQHMYGILDQGAGVLHVYERKETDVNYKAALDIVHSLNAVVDQLYGKTKKLS